MTRPAWTVEEDRPSDERPVAERAPAYAADDGAFALYNDYHDGRAVLVLRPRAVVPRDVVRLWQGASGSDGTHPLGPRTLTEGYGVFTFPYGPITMGVPESGKFEVTTYGERVLNLAPVGGFKSRRVRASVRGRPVADAALLIERIAGNFSAAHVAAFLAAAESAEGREVPREELWIRGFAQELQRIYNHLHVLARVAEAASQNVGLAQTHALAEEVLRIQGTAFGHRWLFGALLPNGPVRRLDATDRRRLSGRIDAVEGEFDRLWELFLGSRTFVDRIQSTCSVPRDEAIRWGATGPTLRASGVPWDDRLRVPSPPYEDLFVALPVQKEGDALSRVLVRGAEIRSSLLLIEQMLERWPSATSLVPPAEPVAEHRGIGRTEAPSGDLVYDVRVEDGRVADVGWRTPSVANWPLFALGMRDAVFTDFHFALESFGFAFAETDG